MDRLLRDLAPVSDAAWHAIDDEARSRLSALLGARRLADFSGPHGWEASSVPLGRVEDVTPERPGDADVLSGVQVRRRVVAPLVELRTDFDVSRSDLRDIDRGAVDPDFGALEDAAARLAVAENRAIIHGLDALGIRGLTEASSHEPVAASGAGLEYPGRVAEAVEKLREVGVDGPYVLALGLDEHTKLFEATDRGYPVVDHLREIVGGPIVWTAGIEGGVLVSRRGGDFVFHCGSDVSLGYAGHDSESVTFYLEESFHFRVLEPDAAVEIRV
ncbi:MAG: encapsulin [Acidimicrobiia bacterium]|nr:encapsulin [Acidimicrobiia bacterium]